MLTYKEWLLKFIDVNLPIGDLAKDVEADKTFPNSKKREVILEHLESRQAAPIVIDIFERTYRFYREDVNIRD